MAVKFLSDEWAAAVTEALNNSDAFKQSAGSQTAKIQQVVETPEGEKRYFFKLENGQAEVGTGDLEGAEATVSQDYDTAVALSKNELSGTAAYMSGKLKLQGDLMKMMQLQGLFATLPQAVAGVDVEY
ncbi:MAG: SCP2 sterol-binding domain-containing protein [Actinomycetota bacterium]